MSTKTKTPLLPKADFIEADRSPYGHWSYGFEALGVGDQMRCPLNTKEHYLKGQARVLAAAFHWKKRNQQAEEPMRFRSTTRSKYVLLERVA